MGNAKRLQSVADVDSCKKDAATVREREAWFRETMQRAGLRNTFARKRLRRLFAKAAHPLSIQEVSDLSGGSINLVTIYRTVREMTRLGLLERLEFGEGFSRYEAAARREDKDHRHHVVCEHCGQVGDFSGCVVEQTLTAIPELAGFRVERHTLTLYGTCADCRRQSALLFSESQ
jgi:Fur family transcriptional regulator, ferric uptake regulator